MKCRSPQSIVALVLVSVVLGSCSIYYPSNGDSPLATLADITITSGDELEDTTIYVPMTTRIISLTIIDILATGLALSLGPRVDAQLQKIKHSLDLTKVD